MTRWIIAGVLLAVLIVLVVTDELGYAPMEGGTIPGGEVPVLTEGVLPPVAPPLVGDDTDELKRIEVNKTCQPILDLLVELGGEDYRDAVGNVLYGDKGMQPEDVEAICRDLVGKSKDQVVARVAELTGLQP